MHLPTNDSCLSAYLLFRVFSLKLLHSSFSVEYLLLAGEKWMAFRANIYLDLLSCRPCREYLTTGALGCCLNI